MTLQIWIDADAYPNVIKDILFRVAERRQLPLILVANRLIAEPSSPLISAVQVAGGLLSSQAINLETYLLRVSLALLKRDQESNMLK